MYVFIRDYVEIKAEKKDIKRFYTIIKLFNEITKQAFFISYEIFKKVVGLK